MERTYDTFVDNGLFVAAYYLNKEVEEVTIDDLKTVSGIMARLFVDMDNTQYYKGIAFSCFQNTRYTQSSGKIDRAEYIQEQYNTLLDNIGEDEYCSVCGKKHINVSFNMSEKSISSTMRPKISANTFFNYSNNLMFTNVCPVCLMLGMLSIFNIEKNGICMIFDSDDDTYMYNRTYDMQQKLSDNISMEAQEEKKKDRKLIREQILNKISDSDIYDGYIRIISFMNSSQIESWDEEFLSSKDMKFIKEVDGNGHMQEFSLNGMFSGMLRGDFQRDYTKYICDFNKEKIKIEDVELLSLIEEWYGMSKMKMDIIDKLCNAVYEASSKDVLRDLKSVSTYSELQDLLVGWIELVSETVSIGLKEYELLTSIKEWKMIKRVMMVKLISFK